VQPNQADSVWILREEIAMETKSRDRVMRVEAGIEINPKSAIVSYTE
jgi:hypothetical protein